MMLRSSSYKGESSYDNIRDKASKALGEDRKEYRKEFLELVSKAEELSD